MTLEIVDEGKEHIKREKRRRQRMVESQTRRQEFSSRFGDPEERGGENGRPAHPYPYPVCCLLVKTSLVKNGRNLVTLQLGSVRRF